MREDVLEQVVKDWLQLNGYFTIHNLAVQAWEGSFAAIRTRDATTCGLQACLNDEDTRVPAPELERLWLLRKGQTTSHRFPSDPRLDHRKAKAQVRSK